MTSPNNMFVRPGTAITDAAGNQWSIINGQVAVNGLVDQTTAGVVSLAYENGKIWQMNADRLWWAKAVPSDSWSPSDGTATSPLVGDASANNTELTQSSNGLVITDANNDHWSIMNGQVAVNGVIDQTTANVIALAYEGGKLWQENTSGLWYAKANAADTWSPPTATSPIHPDADLLNRVTVSTGSLDIGGGQHNSDSFIFAGTGFGPSTPTVAFLQPMSVVSQLIVQGTQESNGTAATPHVGSVTSSGTVDVNGGIQISEGTLNVGMASSSRFVVDAPSNIGNDGSLTIASEPGGTLQLNATLTLAAGGHNGLDARFANLVGGTVVQSGENDTTDVGNVQGTDFVINGGTLTITTPGAFNGVIGSGTGSAIGIFGGVEIQNAMDVASGTFDTSTDVLSLLTASGTTVGSLHFAGDASGLVMNKLPSGVLAINDRPVPAQEGLPIHFT
jgi:hypothetical protein